MSSMYDLPGFQPEAAVAAPEQVPARPRLRVVPDIPLDFEEAVRTLTPRLVRFATRRLGDRHEAEEVVQEALLRAYKHRSELLTEDDLAAWSTCVTGRLVIDRLRVRGRSTTMADVPEGTRVGRDTAEVVVARDEARTALDALDSMPPRQAAVLWAREVEGLAYDEIGARFDMSEPAVRSILTRARKALRKEYAARGGTLPAGGLAAIAPWADGLGWLERLRGVVGRVAAPAALSVVGAGLLGGTLLLPGVESTRPAAPAVTATVVALADSPAVIRAGGLTRPATTSATLTAASVGRPATTRGEGTNTEISTAARKLTDTVGCQVHDSGSVATLPDGTTIGGPVGAGSGTCAGQRGSTTYVDHELPVVGYVGVTREKRCDERPQVPTPLVKCTNNTQQSNGGTP